ncbi:hypothetical protein BD410DRAFT_770653 [Rickenella mellea]|uniref:Cation/H+ exchanger transmembrane domain-containing protein n=1 Tax=Rickenella mellea TaxID=50990 RepID=A0A4Y7Q5P6_9AGAM|nr:hypothetical protein BD410DRAFT_770653 [Rickenella mellea]
MPEFSHLVVSLGKSVIGKRAAQEQGGLLSGKDPTAVNTADPLRLWIIQLGIIMMTAQALALGLKKIRQPKVIAEVLGGILLGPTAFGRIPGFTEHIFPKDSLPFLSLTANMGLVLFLFIVGLEIETDVIKRNARYSLSIALGGMILPFALGSALAVPLYNEFVDKSTPFTHFMLFTGVAFSITAFPVLCRILTELKLIDTKVGIVVLSAGVGNDIVGWTLLALSVALVNASNSLSALYILLTAVGWTLFLLFPVKKIFLWLARRTGSIESGPTMFFMTMTILMTFASAFFTDVIGVHAIFGGFLAGLVVPREGGLAIAMTEKLEDMVSIIFLPLYFTLSGLSTNLGLLNNGITWGYTVAICSLAYLGKFGGCTSAARLVGFKWREAATIGTLMSCKGLVELIVLNVGLSAGILSQRVFSMFVLEALLLTFMTTPVVTILYPPEYRSRTTAIGDFDNVDRPDNEGDMDKHRGSHSANLEIDESIWKIRFTVVLDKIEHLPGMMTLTQLIQPSPSRTGRSRNDRASSSSQTSEMLQYAENNAVNVLVDALRLIELSDRTSAVMKSSVADTLITTDPLLGVFKTFGELNDLPISTSLSVVTHDDMATRLTDHAKYNQSDLILVPWLPPTMHPPHSSEHPMTPAITAPSHNPFDVLFKAGAVESSTSAVHSHFIRGVFAETTTDVALFVDRPRSAGEQGGRHGKQHILLPFFGGPDDRLALEFVVQLCSNPKISATVVKMIKSDLQMEETPIQKPSLIHRATGREQHQGDSTAPTSNMTVVSMTGHPDTYYGPANTETRLHSETADNITWARYASPPVDSPHPALVADAVRRMTFAEVTSPTPLRAVVLQSAAQMGDATHHGKRLLVVVGRSRRLAVENHNHELKELMEEYGTVRSDVKKTIGDVATALVVAGCNAGLVVVQAATRVLE